jgi:hypothetical protein
MTKIYSNKNLDEKQMEVLSWTEFMTAGRTVQGIIGE